MIENWAHQGRIPQIQRLHQPMQRIGVGGHAVTGRAGLRLAVAGQVEQDEAAMGGKPLHLWGEEAAGHQHPVDQNHRPAAAVLLHMENGAVDRLNHTLWRLSLRLGR